MGAPFEGKGKGGKPFCWPGMPHHKDVPEQAERMKRLNDKGRT